MDYKVVVTAEAEEDKKNQALLYRTYQKLTAPCITPKTLL